MKKEKKTIKIKVTCNTPRGKAEKTEKQLRDLLIRLKHKIIKTEAITGEQFCWILEIPENKLEEFTHRCASLEVKQRAFYRMFIKLIERCNKMLTNATWTTKMIRNWLMKQWRKLMGREQIPKNLDKVSEKEFREYIQFDDLEEFKEFLKKDFLFVEALE